MQRNTKEWIQYGSDNVLWYFAQSLMYAGSIFGVAIAIDAKFENIKNKFLNHNRDEKD